MTFKDKQPLLNQPQDFVILKKQKKNPHEFLIAFLPLFVLLET